MLTFLNALLFYIVRVEEIAKFESCENWEGSYDKIRPLPISIADHSNCIFQLISNNNIT